MDSEVAISDSAYVQKNFPEMSRIAGVEIKEAIDEIIINPLAKDRLEEKDRHLISDEFFHNIAILTAPSEKANAVYVTPSTWTRGITVAGPLHVPYGPSLIGRYVYTNGNSLSGNYWGKVPEGSTETAWGFRGETSSKKELEIGNPLIEHGFRSALPLGYIRLNPDKLRESIDRYWSSDPSLQKAINQHLSVLTERDKEAPTILVRLTDSTQRLEDRYRMQPEDKREPRTFSSREIWESWKLICPELKAYTIKDVVSGNNVPVVRSVLVQSLSEILSDNIVALRGYFTETGITKRYQNIASVLAAGKDLTPTLMAQDFEEARTKDENALPGNSGLHYYQTPDIQDALDTYIELSMTNMELLFTNIIDGLYKEVHDIDEETMSQLHIDRVRQLEQDFLKEFPFSYTTVAERIRQRQ